MIARLGAVGYRLARRIVIGVIGTTILALGVVMLVTPGPGILAILLGLGVLGLEFAWARLWLGRLRDRVGPEAMGAARRHYERIRAALGGRPPGQP